jgi:hypothetical protein
MWAISPRLVAGLPSEMVALDEATGIAWKLVRNLALLLHLVVWLFLYLPDLVVLVSSFLSAVVI